MTPTTEQEPFTRPVPGGGSWWARVLHDGDTGEWFTEVRAGGRDGAPPVDNEPPVDPGPGVPTWEEARRQLLAAGFLEVGGDDWPFRTDPSDAGETCLEERLPGPAADGEPSPPLPFRSLRTGEER